MKHIVRFIVLLLAFFGMSGAWAVESSIHVVKRGETLSRIAGKNWKQVCELNKLQNCGRIVVGQKLILNPVGSGTRSLSRSGSAPSTKSGVFAWKNVGAAPLHGDRCGGRDEATINREAWDYLGLAKAEQVLLEQQISERKHQGLYLKPGDHFEAVAFCQKGKVSFKYNVVAAWPKEKVVYARSYTLTDGRVLYWVLNCNNWVLLGPAVSPPEPAVVEAEAPPEPKEAGEVFETVAARYDYDLAMYAGADPDVRFAGFEGAFFPLLKDTEDGRHALGIGAKGDWWTGANAQGFKYDGNNLTIGPAYKWSGTDGRDVNIKLLAGRVKQSGHQGDYESQQRYNALCLATNYTDASREREGQEALPEWSVWANYCHLVAKKFGHTWQGKSIADTSELGQSKAIISIGGRLYLHKNLETATSGALSGEVVRGLQPFVELGGNMEVPSDPSGHAYLGVRTADKIWTAGVGPHFSSEGVVPGFAVTFDAGRAMKLSIENTRWQATLEGLKANGIDVD